MARIKELVENLRKKKDMRKSSQKRKQPSMSKNSNQYQPKNQRGMQWR